MTPGLMRSSRLKDKLHADQRRNPNDPSKKLVYTRYRNYYISLVRRLKASYGSEKLRDSMHKPKQLWDCINKLTSRAQRKVSSEELCKIQSDPKASLNICNSFFSNVGKNLADSTLKRLKKTQNSLAKATKISKRQQDSIFIQPTDVMEVSGIILQLKSGKSTGTDGIDNTLLKLIKDGILHPLTFIINLSLKTGVFPEIWKVALVAPIFKGGCKKDPGNYRPISLLCSFSKILEKVMNKRLSNYLEVKGILSSLQFGFRTGKNTEDAVNLVVNNIVSHLDKGRKCIGVSLDLAKAFDTVPIPILLKKLELMGIRGCAWNWFRSYLTNRKQCVKVLDHISDLENIDFGVPQGSILGPTLFLCYINDLPGLPLEDADISCYADDTAATFYGNTWQEALEAAERGLAEIVKWLDKNLLTLNTSKTKFLCFHKTKASRPPPSLQTLKIHKCHSYKRTETSTQDENLSDKSDCFCEEIERVESLKYLGVILDDNLSFREHVHNMSNRIRRLIPLMKIMRRMAGLDLLREIYIALCQSLLGYCISVWGGCITSNLIKLERAQRSLLKVMTMKSFRYPTVCLFEDVKLLSVRRLYIFKLGCMGHTTAMKMFAVLSKKRVFHLPFPKYKTAFACRFSPFRLPLIYNQLCKICNLKDLNKYQAKIAIHKELLNWDYQKTENFLKMKQ